MYIPAASVDATIALGATSVPTDRFLGGSDATTTEVRAGLGLDRSEAPEAVHSQRMRALRLGNQIRVQKALLKKDIKTGRVELATILENPPACAQSGTLHEFLRAVPKFGDVRVNNLLRRMYISPTRRLDALSERQVREIVQTLRGEA